MNDENHFLLNHISRRITVCEENINRLKSDLEASNIKVGAQLGKDDHIQEITQFESKDEISQISKKTEILALLEKVDALEVEIVEIRMLYFHKEEQQQTSFCRGFYNRLREQSITLVKKIPPLYYILRKLRGIYILKKSRSLNAQEIQINKGSK
jgi:hypothetical protein